MAYDELNVISNEEYFSVYPYDADLRVKYANELQHALDDYFDDLLENNREIKESDFALLFSLWFGFVAYDQFNNSEYATQLFENEFNINSLARSHEIADLLMQSSETSKFNDYILNGNGGYENVVRDALQRSQNIARNETTSLCNKMLHEEASDGFKYHVWVTTIDKHTRDDHRDANGQIKPIDEPFEVGGEEMMYPHDENASPENTVNCRCVEEFTNDGEGYEDGEVGFDYSEEERTKLANSESVRWSKVNGKEYTEKFSKVSGSEKVVNSLAKYARKALKNRDGLYSEELYAIDGVTGKMVASITNQFKKQGVDRTREFTDAIAKCNAEGHQVITIHNHPHSAPPSVADFNELLKDKNTVGLTVGHNGNVYYYTKPSEKIMKIDTNVAIRKIPSYYSDVQVEIKYREALAEQFNFTLIEL